MLLRFLLYGASSLQQLIRDQPLERRRRHTPSSVQKPDHWPLLQWVIPRKDCNQWFGVDRQHADTAIPAGEINDGKIQCSSMQCKHQLRCIVR